jgi:hypothetical protein
MTDVHPRKRPGVVLLGYAVMALVMVAMVAAYLTHALDRLGWHGGDYSQSFLALTGFGVVFGAVLWARPPGSPWRSFGFGLVLGGLTSGALTVLVVVLIGVAFSHSSIPF